MPALANLRIVARILWDIAPARVLASGVGLVGVGLAEGATLALLLPLLTLVGVDAGGASRPVADWLDAVLRRVSLAPSLGLVLLLYVGVAAAQSLLARWQAQTATVLDQQAVAALRRRLYRAISGATWEFLSRRRLSTLAHVLTSEVDRVGVAAWLLLDWLASAAIAVVYLGMAFRLAPSMTGAVVAASLGLVILTRGLVRGSQRSGEALSRSGDRLLGGITDHLASLKLARTVGAVPEHGRILAELTGDLQAVRVHAARQHTGLRHRMTVGSAAALAGAVYVAHGVLGLPPAQLVLLLFVYGRLMPRLMSLHQRVQLIAHALPAVDAVIALERDCLDAAEPEARRGDPIQLRQRVCLDGVTFAYRDRTQPAVDHVDLSIAAGAMVAIVGPSGAGKSTVGDLLTGLLQADEGRVTVDEHVLDHADRDRWRAALGYVPQDAWFFHDTIRQNLRWAHPPATDDDLWRALGQAAVAEFVAALPQGLDTVIGDRGVLLSGGERQRLALARALVRRPQLLILDEATSALDVENESRILEALQALRGRVTVVVITHRLALARAADTVYVMERGRVVEGGGWDRLMANPDGRLRALWQAHERVGEGAPLRSST